MPVGPGAPTAGGIPGFNTAYVLAHAGGGATGATPLPGFLNIVTAITAADSVVLPPCWAGASIMVINNGSVSVSVYAYAAASGAADSMQASNATTGAATTGQGLATGQTRLFVGMIPEGGNTVGGVGPSNGGIWKIVSIGG